MPELKVNVPPPARVNVLAVEDAAVVNPTLLLNTMLPPETCVHVLLALAFSTNKLNVCVAVELLVRPALIWKYFALVVPKVYALAPVRNVHDFSDLLDVRSTVLKFAPILPN